MKKLILIISLLAMMFAGFSQRNPEQLYRKYMQNLAKINKFSYNITRIDTFVNGGGEGNESSGYALIERNPLDTVLGFHFYGHRYDTKRKAIYDGTKAIQIDVDKKEFHFELPRPGFMGAPGAQMVLDQLIKPESSYTHIKLEEKENSYVILMDLPDVTAVRAVNRMRTVEFDKQSFLPIRTCYSYELLQNKGVHIAVVSNLRIDDEVEGQVADKKNELQNLRQKEIRKMEAAFPLINQPLMPVSLKDLHTGETYALPLTTAKPVLLDFWEVWCGPCIKSLDKVDHLHQKYGDKVEIVSIVSENFEKARLLLEEKGIDFPAKIGDRALLKTFEVSRIPRYFLINQQGIIIKDYYGFSDQIEADIVELIN